MADGGRQQPRAISHPRGRSHGCHRALATLPWRRPPRTPRRRPSPSTPGALTLVAYSTPREAYEEIIPLFQATEAGAGRRVRAVVRRLRRPEPRRVEAGLPADVVALSLWPDVERLVEPGIVAGRLGRRTTYKGIVHDSVVVLRRPPRQPQGHPDLGRPHPRRRRRSSRPTRSPRAARSGTSWPPTGARSRPARPRRRPSHYLTRAVRQHRRSRTRAPATRSTTFLRGPGRRAHRLRERGHLRPAGGPAASTTSCPDNTMLIENPVAVTLNGDAPDAGQGLRGLPVHARGPDRLRQAGLPAGGRRGRSRSSQTSRRPPACSPSTDLGGWAEVTHRSSSTRTPASWPRSSASSASSR